MVAAQHGSEEAFALLARAHGDRLFAIGQRILRDAALAEDALQQALLQGWRQLPNLRDPDRFQSWLTRLLVNECYAELRRRRRRTVPVRVLPVDVAVSKDEILSVGDRDAIDRAFARLSPEQRAVLVLQYFIGLVPAEIADELGVPLGTVRSRLHYGQRAMRAALEADMRSVAAGGSSR